MFGFADVVINTRKHYMERIYDDFECCISFKNSKIVRDSKYNFLTYNIVIYFIKRPPYISYNRYINRR